MKTSRPSRLGYSIGDEPIPGYRLVRFLGEGGFGEVWQVTAPGGTPAALKIVDLGTRQGQKEFRALAAVKQLQHPNLVPISAFWLKDANGRVLETADVEAVAAEGLRPPSRSAITETLVVPRYAPPLELIIAMGLGEKSLQQRLAECKEQGLPGIPHAELLRYLEDAARAIDHLVSPHNRHGTALGGMQHGDIKPLNILIVGDAAQVCDFGLARVLTDNRKTAMAYSAPYVAPEVIEQNDPSAAGDQYALAVSYVELRTGELPFRDGCDGIEILEAHKSGSLDLTRLEPAERAVIARATARDPAARYPSAGAMVRALREAVEPQQPVQPSAHRRRLAATLVAAVVVLVSGAFAAYLKYRPQPRVAASPQLDPDVKLIEPEQVIIHAGDPTIRETLEFQRTSCDAPIRLEWLGTLPKGVKAELPEVPRGKDSAKLEFTADVGADVGSTNLVLQAAAGEIRREFTLKLTVHPVQCESPPPGYQVAEESEPRQINGRWRASKIECVKDELAGLKVYFVLIASEKNDSVPAFYIMENKVWYDLFAQCAKNEAAMAGEAWQNQNDNDPAAGAVGAGPNGRWPVFNVTWREAEKFAEWLGGRLPSVREWDKAAGRSQTDERGEPLRQGPFKGEWSDEMHLKIAVCSEHPWDVGAADDDVSFPFRCRDMSGNGKEWTCTNEFGNDYRGDGMNGDVADERFQLRGQSFAAERPLMFFDLKRLSGVGVSRPTKPSTQIGFRVLIDIGD